MTTSPGRNDDTMNEYRPYWNKRVISDKRLYKGYVTAFNRIYEKAIEIKGVPDLTFIENAIRKTTTQLTVNTYYAGVLRGMNEVQQKYGKKLPFVKGIEKGKNSRPLGLKDVLHVGLPGPSVIIINHVAEPTKKMAGGIYETISNTISESRKAGEDTLALTQRLKALKDTSRGRARNAAATMATRVFNDGSLMGYAKSGVATGKKWVVNLMGNVRPWHLVVNGQERPLIGSFFVHGELLLYPGDAKGKPDNIMNCRCGVAAVIGRKPIESTIPAGNLNKPYTSYYESTVEEVPDTIAPSSVSMKTGEDLVMEDILKNESISSFTKLEGGSTEGHIMITASGKKAVWKPRSPIMGDVDNKEVAAYEVDRILGINRVPVTVHRTIDDRIGSAQKWEEGDDFISYLINNRIRSGEDLTSLPITERQKLTLFDYIISNSDRNEGNVIITKDGKIALIDHGYSFKDEPFMFDRYTQFPPIPGEKITPEISMIIKGFNKATVEALHSVLFDSGLLSENEYSIVLRKLLVLMKNQDKSLSEIFSDNKLAYAVAPAGTSVVVLEQMIADESEN